MKFKSQYKFIIRAFSVVYVKYFRKIIGGDCLDKASCTSFSRSFEELFRYFISQKKISQFLRKKTIISSEN